MKRQEWYTSLFDELGAYWTEIADARNTEKEVMLIEKTARTRGLTLDLCCGTGRHSILLAKKGWNMVGLDVSTNLLRTAKERMTESGVHFPLVRGEMCHLPFKAEVFAATINMFTSFGYLPSEKEDLKSLKEVVRTLSLGGLFLIDIVNREHLLRVFQEKDWGEFLSFYMLETRTLDAGRSRLYSQWILIEKNSGKTGTFDHNLRLYSLPQLQKMLAEAGFIVEKVYGGYEGQEYSQDSSRLIVLAKRKGKIY